MLKDFDCITRRETAAVKVRANFHTHNYLCGHAEGTVCDYVAQAIKNGLSVLGISDHFMPPIGGYAVYLSPKDIATEYLPQFEEARARYGDRIRILSGGEIEYFEGFDGYYKNLLSQLDYLVLGQHLYYLNGQGRFVFDGGVDEENVLTYFEHVKKGIESDMFSLVAHPDAIFGNCEISPKIVNAFDAVVRLAVEHDVPLELNANGIRSHGCMYPTDLSVALCKKYDAKVVVSSDCHSPKDLCDEYVLKLYVYAQKNGLNVVDTIPLKK